MLTCARSWDRCYFSCCSCSPPPEPTVIGHPRGAMPIFQLCENRAYRNPELPGCKWVRCCYTKAAGGESCCSSTCNSHFPPKRCSDPHCVSAVLLPAPALSWDLQGWGGRDTQLPPPSWVGIKWPTARTPLKNILHCPFGNI